MAEKIYVTPELEITEFNTEDVITTSPGNGEGWDQFGSGD